jgi:hypothetical protein
MSVASSYRLDRRALEPENHRGLAKPGIVEQSGAARAQREIDAMGLMGKQRRIERGHLRQTVQQRLRLSVRSVRGMLRGSLQNPTIVRDRQMIRWNDFVLQAFVALGALLVGWTFGISFAEATPSRWLKDYQTLIGVIVAVAVGVAAYFAVKQQSLITLMLHEHQRMETALPGMRQAASLLSFIEFNVGSLKKGEEIVSALYRLGIIPDPDNGISLRAPAATSLDRQRCGEAIRLANYWANELKDADLHLSVSRANFEVAGKENGEAFLQLSAAELRQQVARDFFKDAVRAITILHDRYNAEIISYEQRLPKAENFLSRFFERL